MDRTRDEELVYRARLLERRFAKRRSLTRQLARIDDVIREERKLLRDLTVEQPRKPRPRRKSNSDGAS